jgi:small subunit ribosomal protein S4e
MVKHMAQHMKTIASPRSWPIHRKENAWIAAPRGGHSVEYALPLGTVMRDLLKLTKTRKETRYIILNKDVLVNGKKVKNEKAQFGLLDVLAFPETKQYYTLVLNTRGKLQLKELNETEAKTKIASIVGKTYLPKKKVQLNLFGGLNVIVDKDTYGVGDAVVVSLADNKIKEHIKLEKGAKLYLITGKNIAQIADVTSVEKSVVMCKDEEGDEFKVDKKGAFVVGKGKLAVSL